MNIPGCQDQGGQDNGIKGRVRSERAFQSPGRPYTVYVLDRCGTIIDTNETVAPLTGYDMDELVGKGLAEYLDERSRASLSDALEARADGNNEDLEAMIKCRDRRERPVRGFMVALRDEDGRLSGLMVYLEPALVWVAPEEAEAAGQEKDLADLVSDAVIEADKSGRVTGMNRAGRGMLGYGGEDSTTDLSLSMLFDPAGTDQSLPGRWENALSPQVAICRHQNGKRFIGKVSARRRVDGGFILVIQNLAVDKWLERFGLAMDCHSRAGNVSFAILEGA